jgi:hypothetical protein
MSRSLALEAPTGQMAEADASLKVRQPWKAASRTRGRRRRAGRARGAPAARARPRKSMEQAHHEGWTVVGIKNDWATVFPDT